ncbi:LysR family transcriptional regulator [Erwiniaceae bacterium L1_54_6]|jgi:DNA-binding transcriptional LysR family regulator|uniref:LysR family transcriptional regulator n=1 Tax=Pantoea cypripedii TaxID=55209 RepID=A0A6B9G5W2_PANCY|nr:LysR family transcriptional regulator [Pantoea cypripedii]MDF7660268.1 LysR family transcriptional regulator [Erwiniaceae bacterium L1_54_6]QGY30510.1 LysR family transcriptional regulator [Pantoea cypripedii]
MFNPQWLKSFAMLAELGSFTESADRLGITQAAVSQHIRHLEQQLGPLILRSKRPLELTPAGLALLDYCQEVDRAQRHLTIRLSEEDVTCGEVSLISPGSIGLRLYPLLLALQQQYPDLSIRHRFAPDSEVMDAVLHNRYEMGLVTQKPDDKRLVAEKFAEEPLELVVPAGVKVHDWADLETLGYIDHPDGQAMATRLLSRRFPGNPGVRNLPQRGFSNQISLILEPVARGLGFAVIPQSARLAFARPEAIQVESCGVSLVDTIWLIHRAEWPLSGRAQQALRWLEGKL